MALGPRAAESSAYYWHYAGLAAALIASLAGLLFLERVRQREHVEAAIVSPPATSILSE